MLSGLLENRENERVEDFEAGVFEGVREADDFLAVAGLRGVVEQGIN